MKETNDSEKQNGYLVSADTSEMGQSKEAHWPFKSILRTWHEDEV